MKKVESVISLINSFSKSEKKHVNIQIVQECGQKDYLVIYDIIAGNRRFDGRGVKEEFLKRRPEGSFEVSVQYLYDKLLNTLFMLRRGKDTFCDFLNDLCKVRMLYDRSMFGECFELLDDTICNARQHEDYEVLLLAQKLELEYLLRLNFPGMTEQALFRKHFNQNEALTRIRSIAEQSAQHNLLKYRLTRIRSIRTDKQMQSMNDLMLNESHIVSSSDPTSNFELMRNHRLFQANYLMGTGDHHAALEAYKVLNRLFEENPQHWQTPPIYYLSVLEGVLEGLRSMGYYDQMPYFLAKLRLLIDRSSLEFKVNATCLLFQYELFPHMDRGDFAACSQLMESYRESLYDKEVWLSPLRKSELLLYTALAHIGNQNYKVAKKYISQTLIDHNIRYLPLMKTIRLVQLIVYYELQEFDLVHHESRSILRKLSSPGEHAFKTERLILWFLNKNNLPVMRRDREVFRKRLSGRIDEIYNDKYEQQLLCIFDFVAWMESRILKKTLAEVLADRARADIAVPQV